MGGVDKIMEMGLEVPRSRPETETDSELSGGEQGEGWSSGNTLGVSSKYGQPLSLLTPRLIEGKNHLALVCWRGGVPGARELRTSLSPLGKESWLLLAQGSSSQACQHIQTTWEASRSTDACVSPPENAVIRLGCGPLEFFKYCPLHPTPR